MRPMQRYVRLILAFLRRGFAPYRIRHDGYSTYRPWDLTYWGDYLSSYATRDEAEDAMRRHRDKRLLRRRRSYRYTSMGVEV